MDAHRPRNVRSLMRCAAVGAAVVALLALGGCVGDVDFDAIEPTCEPPSFDVASRDLFCSGRVDDLAPSTLESDHVLGADSDPTQTTAAVLSADDGLQVPSDDGTIATLLGRYTLGSLRAGDPLQIPAPNAASVELSDLPRGEIEFAMRFPPVEVRLLDVRGDLIWVNYGIIAALLQRSGDTLSVVPNSAVLANRALLPLVWAPPAGDTSLHLRANTRALDDDTLILYVSSLLHMRAMTLDWDPASQAWSVTPTPVPSSYTSAANAVCGFQCLVATGAYPYRNNGVEPDILEEFNCTACPDSTADDCPLRCRHLPDCYACVFVNSCDGCDCDAPSPECQEWCDDVGASGAVCAYFEGFPRPTVCDDTLGMGALDACMEPAGDGQIEGMGRCYAACQGQASNGTSPDFAFPILDEDLPFSDFGANVAVIGGIGVYQSPDPANAPDRIFIGSNGAIYQARADDLTPQALVAAFETLNAEIAWNDLEDLYDFNPDVNGIPASIADYFAFTTRAGSDAPGLVQLDRIALPSLEGQRADDLVVLDLVVQDDTLYALTIRQEVFNTGTNPDVNLFFLIAFPLDDGTISTAVDANIQTQALEYADAGDGLNPFSSRLVSFGSGLIGVRLVSFSESTGTTGLLRVYDTFADTLVEVPARPLTSGELVRGDYSRPLATTSTLNTGFVSPIATPVLQSGDTRTVLLPTPNTLGALELTVGGASLKR